MLAPGHRVRNRGCPLIPPHYLYLDLPVHVMNKVSRFCRRAHTLAVESSIWCSGLHILEMAVVSYDHHDATSLFGVQQPLSMTAHFDKCSCVAVQNVPVVHVPFKFQDLFVCTLRKKYSFLISLFASPFLSRPHIFCMPCLVTQSFIAFLNGTTNYAILSRTSWTFLGLAKTSNKPISLPTS